MASFSTGIARSPRKNGSSKPGLEYTNQQIPVKTSFDRGLSSGELFDRDRSKTLKMCLYFFIRFGGGGFVFSEQYGGRGVLGHAATVASG